jgi:prepilin peptidase CpaA
MTMPVTTVCVIAIALVACVWDVKSARIPNWLTFTAAVAAVVFHALAPQGHGLGAAVGGLLLGLAIFFPLFALRAMGAGDIKLLAALGAWIGWSQVFWVAMYASVAGGVLAIVVMLARGHFWKGLQNIRTLLTFWMIAGVKPLPSVSLDDPKSVRLPYAVPIAVGLMVTLWRR